MADTPTIDLSAGLTPKQPAQTSAIDLSAGLTPKAEAAPRPSGADQEAAAFAQLGQAEYQQMKQTPMKGSTLGGVYRQLQEGPQASANPRAAAAKAQDERAQQDE